MKININLEDATLEQLIEACGKDFLELSVGQYKDSHSKKGFWWAYEKHLDLKKSVSKRLLGKTIWKWFAGDTNELGWQWINKGEGLTAKEAVKDLVLKLKKYD